LLDYTRPFFAVTNFTDDSDFIHDLNVE